MNRLNLDRRTQVIGTFVEGNSIRSNERMTGIHRDTIMRPWSRSAPVAPI